MSAPSQLANTTVATSITINVAPSRHATVATSINKCFCQHTDNKSPMQSTMVWLGRCHLAFADCVLNLRFAASLMDAAATGCWRGPQYDGKCSFYFNCYFFRTTPTNRDLREKAVYFPSRNYWWFWILKMLKMSNILIFKKK